MNNTIFAKRNMLIEGMTAAIAILWYVLPASAHHSFAMFDSQKTLTTDATVRQFKWESPHTWLDLLVPGKESTPLSLELTAISALVRAGWKPTTLAPGDKVTVTYHPMRDGSPAGQLIEIVTKDGRRLKG
jgi:hypothetical protein